MDNICARIWHWQLRSFVRLATILRSRVVVALQSRMESFLDFVVALGSPETDTAQLFAERLVGKITADTEHDIFMKTKKCKVGAMDSSLIRFANVVLSLAGFE